MGIQTSHDQAAWRYVDFTNTDLYSIEEDRAIGVLVARTLGPALETAALRVGDFGCGAGLPHVIWRRLFSSLEQDALRYEGFDSSPAMIRVAEESFWREMLAGRARFQAGTLEEALPTISTDAYDLTFSLHGTLSRVEREKLPAMLDEIKRVTAGHVVVDFLSRAADRRAPEHPRRALYEPRHVDAEPFWVETYTTEEAKRMLAEAGLEPVAVQGLGIEGSRKEVHARFVQRQAALPPRAEAKSRDQEEWSRLERDVRSIAVRDVILGRREPDRADRFAVIAKKSGSG